MTEQNKRGDATSRHNQLHQLLRSAPPSPSECATFLPQLDAYIEAQLAGEDYLNRYPEIASHLDSCLACADSYARLYELEVTLAAEALPALPIIPAPDLSFLSTPASAPTTKSSLSLLDLLADALTTTANRIRLQLTPDLLALLQPQPSASLTRSAKDDARYHELLYELQPQQYAESAIPIKLIAYRDAEQPELCLLEVTVAPAGERWPNLGGRTVILQIGSERRTATTDAWGVAAFVDVAIARLGEITLEVGLTK